jgi:hypothetical protein
VGDIRGAVVLAIEGEGWKVRSRAWVSLKGALPRLFH